MPNTDASRDYRQGKSLRRACIAEKQVLAAINAVSGIVTVHSDIGGGLAGPKKYQPRLYLYSLVAGQC